MYRVEINGTWSLFCPLYVPFLTFNWGEVFDFYYKAYEVAGLTRRSFTAQMLWFAILQSQIETGTPFMLYKDHCNRKTNQKNLGSIKSSNLCTEVIQFSCEDETAVCNLASLSLSRFVYQMLGWSQSSRILGALAWKERIYDFYTLSTVTCQSVANLNIIIDINFYPVLTSLKSNLAHRPVGLGVQGLADTFLILGMAFETFESQLLNIYIFEAIYFHSLQATCILAVNEGHYPSYSGCPVSLGILQQDMWLNLISLSRQDWR
jgi:ribonucleoside-diphosphate reductase subunit M1